MGEYILGSTEEERRRLALQQEVWGEVTRSFLDRIGVDEGWSVLDAGCGPGMVLLDLRERVGDGGRVVGLDASQASIEQAAALVAERGWRNVEPRQGRIEELALGGGEPEETFDLVFLRWVLSFPPDPRDLLEGLVRLLRPGGWIAIQDYNHEGVSVFPESEGFRSVIEATRRFYAAGGGDAWVAARLPGWLRELGLELCEYTPNVLCGGPGSPAFRWADTFFTHHADPMVDAGVLEPAERDRFLAEWAERRADPATVFFSPIVVDVAARRPG